MRHSHNAKHKRDFIQFRNYIRRALASLRIDFKRSKDPELNAIADMFNIQIIKWSPRCGEALVCIYNSRKYPEFNFNKVRYYPDCRAEWISTRSYSHWRLYDLINTFIMDLRAEVKKDKDN